MLDDGVNIDPESAIRIAYEGCVFFYPLVLLDAARRQPEASAAASRKSISVTRVIAAAPAARASIERPAIDSQDDARGQSSG